MNRSCYAISRAKSCSSRFLTEDKADTYVERNFCSFLLVQKSKLSKDKHLDYEMCFFLLGDRLVEGNSLHSLVWQLIKVRSFKYKWTGFFTLLLPVNELVGWFIHALLMTHVTDPPTEQWWCLFPELPSVTGSFISEIMLIQSHTTVSTGLRIYKGGSINGESPIYTSRANFSVNRTSSPVNIVLTLTSSCFMSWVRFSRVKGLALHMDFRVSQQGYRQLQESSGWRSF